MRFPEVWRRVLFLSIITFLWLMGVESGDWTQTKCDCRVCYMEGEEIWTDAKLSEQWYCLRFKSKARSREMQGDAGRCTLVFTV
jgi:hypothetical protein